MTDEEIVLYFNEHRFAKPENYLLKDGSSVEHELQNLLDRFVRADCSSEHERMEVEAQIELEREREAAAREASCRFAVVHFREGDDDFFFTSNCATTSTASQICTAHAEGRGRQIYAGQYRTVEFQRVPDDQRYDVLRSVQCHAK